MIKNACDGKNNKIIISGNQSECESKIGIGPPKYSDAEEECCEKTSCESGVQ